MPLRGAGLEVAGAGENIQSAAKPAILDLGAKGRVLVFAFAHESSFTPRSWAATDNRPGVNLLENYGLRSLQSIRNQIAATKRQNDIVVLSLHWGPNWGFEVGWKRRWFARRLIDLAEVDVVYGHSPHHPLGVEIYQNRPIIYGCGDLLNDYERIPCTHVLFEKISH